MQSSEQYAETLRSVFRSVAAGTSQSRASLARALGISRSTAGNHVDALIRRGRLEETGIEDPSLGRPARTIRVAEEAGVMAAIDVRPERIAIGIATPSLSMLDTVTWSDGDGASPRMMLDWISGTVARVGRGPLLSAAASVPAPVFAESGTVAPLSIHEVLWEGTYLVDALLEPLGAPYVIENDATLRARREASLQPQGTPLLYLHLSHGVGSGVVDEDGRAWRGAEGVAGNLAHVRLRSAPTDPCFCGLQGCAAPAVTLRSVIADAGVASVPELQAAVRARDARTVDRVRRYASDVGELAAVAVNLLNPRSVVLSGELSGLGDTLLSGVRASIYENSLPVTTRNLAVSLAPDTVALTLAAAGAAGLGVVDVTVPRGPVS